MRKFQWTVVMASLAAAGLAQFGPVLYAPGRTIKDQGISLKSWGSGTIAETDEAAYEGTNSIRISTRNYFQGGIIQLEKPVDLGVAFKDPSSLLRLMVFVPGSNTVFGGRGPIGGPMGGPIGGPMGGPLGGPGGLNRGGQTNRRQGGGGVGMGGPLGGPMGGPMGGPGLRGAGGDPELRSVRVVVTTTDGKRSEAYAPIERSQASSTTDRGWQSVGIPLQAIAGFERTNKVVQSIAVAGDSPATLFVGDIRVLTDETPITGDTNVRELNLALGDEVQLVAYGFAGATPLEYSWDFDAKDGISDDAMGQVVRRRFRKPGQYTITVTIRDKFGLKKPFTTTIDVTVNP
ncbi:MAG: PKD domain-containing protein [Fimbriimonadales bacterium]|nr:PKD domain-containing protein [Fimbriimonadales bacterium]